MTGRLSFFRPSMPETLPFISFAAWVVKVRARMLSAGTPLEIRWATLIVITLVLPLPAPASTSSGPSVLSTASFWRGFRLLISLLMFEDIADHFTLIRQSLARVVRLIFCNILKKCARVRS